MKKILSFYSLKYPKTLVYMLQSSEYKIDDYLQWVKRTKDFSQVAKRRQLDGTIKARLILALLWLVIVLMVALACVFILIFQTLWSVLVAVVILLITPWLISYVIVVPLYLGHVFIQKPREKRIIASARQIIANHKGLKIAIAGSYGKTTAKEILKTVLSQGKKVAFTPGNMNTLIGISRFTKTLVGDEDIIIFELGEERLGDVRELCDLTQPDMGVITGISEAHLSSFGTIENTISTIFGLQDYLGNRTLYKNQESQYVASKIKSGDDLAFNREGVNGWKVSNPKVDITGTSFTAKKAGKTISAHTGLLGLHNIGIITVTISIADELGLTLEQITAGLNETVPFEHRMQPRRIHGAWLIDDTYNGNSEGVRAGLLLLKEIEAKRRIYVTPGLVEQGDKTREVHEKIGNQIASVADVVVLMKNSVTKFIVNGLNEAKFNGQLLIIDNPLEFYSNLEHFVAAGDVVLMQNDWTDNFA